MMSGSDSPPAPAPAKAFASDWQESPLVVHSLAVAQSWKLVSPVPQGEAAQSLVRLNPMVPPEKLGAPVPQQTWVPHVEADVQLSVVVTVGPPSPNVYVIVSASPPLLDPPLEPLDPPLLAVPLLVPGLPSPWSSPFPEVFVVPPHAATIVATVVAVKAKMVIFFMMRLLRT